MATNTIQSKLEEFVSHSTELGETAYKLARVNAVRKTANISTNLLFTIVSSVILLFTILFGSIAAAWWLGNILDSLAAGFLIVSGFYLLLLGIIFKLKKKILLPWFRNKIVQKIYE